MLNVTGDQESGADVPAAYGRKVGERLRLIRRQKRMSLQEVEALVEPGVQGVGPRRLRARRARHLGASAAAAGPLLQRPGRPAPAQRRRPLVRRRAPAAAPSHDGSVTIDLRRLERLNGAEADMLSRYLTMIQLQRQDFNGRMLTIRRDDLRAIACILGVTYEGRAGATPRPQLAPSASASERPAGVTCRPERFGVYVHIPFCARRCDYCAFATWTDRDHLVGDYLDAVVRDIEHAVDGGLLADGGGRSRRSSSGAAPRRSCPRTSWCGSCPRYRRDGRGGGHRRVQSRHRVAGAVRHVPRAAASTGSPSGCSRWSRTCWPRSAAPTTSRASAGPWPTPAVPGSTT